MAYSKQRDLGSTKGTDNDALLNRLCKRYDRLKETRYLWEPTWQDLADLVMPRKGTITQRTQEGARLTQRLFDSTAIVANELLAASLQGALTSDAFKWFRLKTRKQELNDNKNVAEWLDEVADRMYLAFRQSNLNSELQEVYLDLGCFGNACVYMEEADSTQAAFSGFRFHYVQIGRWTISENKDGLVDTVFRTVAMTAHAAALRWPTTCGEKIAKVAENDPDKRIYVVHAVYPRSGMHDPGYKGTLPFASVYFTYGGASPAGDVGGQYGKCLLAVDGTDYFPYMVPRWTKAINEMYGRGPGDTALPDIKTLNKAEELTLRAWAKNIDPPLLTRDDGVIGRIKTSPSDIITARDMDAVKPLETAQRFDVNQVKSDQKRESIKQIFYNQQLQLPEGQVMTATEVERRYELMQRFLGPTLGRITVELLNPLVQRAFYLMLKRRALPPPPRELMSGTTGMEPVDIEYEGPLARAQRATDVQAVERSLQDLTALLQMDPNVKDNLDLDWIARLIVERNGVPPQALRDLAEVAKIRKARIDAQNQAIQAKQQTEALKAVGPAVKGLAALPGVQEAKPSGG